MSPLSNYRIISPERLGEVFHQELIPLRYTPRKMLVYPTTGNLITIETDHNTYPALIQGGLRQRLLEAQQEPSAAAADGDSVRTLLARRQVDLPQLTKRDPPPHLAPFRMR
jgi:hypothetical protein